MSKFPVGATRYFLALVEYIVQPGLSLSVVLAHALIDVHNDIMII